MVGTVDDQIWSEMSNFVKENFKNNFEKVQNKSTQKNYRALHRKMIRNINKNG